MASGSCQDKSGFEKYVDSAFRILQIANRHQEIEPLLGEFVEEVKSLTDCAAVGIRVLDESGYIPYRAYQGFSRHFYEKESPLSIDSDKCMCINVVKGTTDPRLPFYTDYGSFYMNGTTSFLATVNPEEKGSTRNVCNQTGYESVALIPIRYGPRILGLIHLADTRDDMVPLEMVKRLEQISAALGAGMRRIIAEATLIRERRMLQDLIDNADPLLAYLDRDFNFVSFNAAYARASHHTASELLGRNHFYFYPHEENERIFRQVRDTGETVSFRDKPFVYHDQPERGVTYWDWSLTPVKDDKGCVEGLVFSLVETTEQKRAELALRRNESRFRLLSETAARLLATDNPQGIVNELCREVMAHLDCQAFFNFLVDEGEERMRLNACAGIPDEEMKRIEWLDFGVAVCGCVARDRQRIIAEDIANTPDIRTDLVRSYGIQAYCCHPLLSQGRLIGTLSFGTKTRPRFTDDEVELMRIITDQVALAMQRIIDRQALRESEEKYRTLFEESPNPVIEWDFSLAKRCLGDLRRNGGADLRKWFEERPDAARRCMELMKAARINRRALQLYGVSDVEEYNESLHTMTAEMLIANLGSFVIPILGGKLQGDQEASAINTLGDRRDILARWATIPGYEESLEKVLVSSVDITDVKKLQKELQRKNRELEDFFHHLSHSMKNGLMVIKRWGELAISSPDLMLNASSQLMLNADSLISTVENLLALLKAGMAVPDKREMDLRPLLEELYETVKPENLRARLLTEVCTAPIPGDPALMKQIFQILFSNSFKNRDPAKEIVTIGVRSSIVDEKCRISYSDNGRGLTEEIREKLFHTWFTPEKKQPRGFGLSIVKKLVDAHGGTIEARSGGPGQGVEFLITL